MWRCGTAPDPGMGASMELTGGEARGECARGAVRQTLTGIGRAAQEAPPALDAVEPGGAGGDEDRVHAARGTRHAGVHRQPVRRGWVRWCGS